MKTFLHIHIPSACNICNKEFKTKLLLNAHKRIVHSETSYACNECAKTFSCRNGLKTPNKALHEKKLIECSVCLKEISVHNVKRHKDNCNKRNDTVFIDMEDLESELHGRMLLRGILHFNSYNM